MEIAAGIESNRRCFTERRRRPTPIWGGLVKPCRRKGFRRAGEERNRYVDRLRPRIVLWALVIMTLSALDAALTLLHIEIGGEEVVPTMRWALNYGDLAFIASKMALTALGTAYLALHQNFTLARFAFRFLLAGYLSLMLYHAALAAMNW